MRLDVRAVQRPGPLALRANELERAFGGVRGLGVGFCHARGQPRVAHPPPGHDAAVGIHGAHHVLGPRVLAVVAVLAQVCGVRAARLGTVSVVAIELDEAARAEEPAALARGVEREPRHACRVGDEVGLAGEHERAVSARKILPQRHLTDRQRHAIPGRAMARHVATGVERHARRPAHARLHEGTLEANTACGKRVDVARGEMRMPIAAEMIGAQLIAHDEQKIAHRAHGRRFAP